MAFMKPKFINHHQIKMEYMAILSFLGSSILTAYIFALTGFRFSTFEIFDYSITGVELTLAVMLAIIHYWFLVELKFQVGYMRSK
jgi:hypothetical protein